MPTKTKDTLPARPRSIVRVASAVAIAIVVMLGATTWITVRVDRQMEAREAALVRALLSERLRDLSRAAQAIAAGLAENPAAAAAIPASWAGAAGDPEIERVYVVAADGRIDSARIHGVTVETERPADLGAAIATLAGRLRSPVASARPAADAGLVAAANGPLLLAAAAAAGTEAPTVVVVSPLMKGRLAEAALVQSLAGLRFRTDGPIGEAETALPVTDLWGRKAGAFAWTGAAPGRAILWTIFPVSLAVLVGLGAMASAAVHHVGRSTQRLAESESRALQLALCDPLTGVSNRLQFFEALSESIRNARAGQRYALLLVDLDRFKDVNDTFGHHVGDALLATVSQRLRELCGEEAIVARIGGDEFALLLSGPVSEARALKAAQEMVRALRRPVRTSGHTLEVGCSIGIAIAPDHGSERSELMRRADIALYAAKAEGRGRVAVFAPEIEKEYRYRRFVERELRAAILTDEITLDYQPIYGADGSEMIGVEALVRWRHSFRGMIPPAEFIAVAEETGLIVDLGRRVLDLACQAGASWPDLFVAVNLSPVQVRRPEIVATVRDALAKSGLPPSRLVLEVTEGIFLADDADTMATLGQLRRLGVKIALDDFGTGYSSLGYLRRFQFDKLKIDQSFLHGLGESADTAVILHAIVNLGRGLGLVVTAEGVETDEHFRFLRAAGCHELQGYHFAKPMSAAAVSRLIGGAPKAVALA